MRSSLGLPLLLLFASVTPMNISKFVWLYCPVIAIFRGPVGFLWLRGGQYNLSKRDHLLHGHPVLLSGWKYLQMLPCWECKHILPPLSVTESKYSNVVPLSASAPWSNRGRGEAELDQPIPNHNYTINSHFSGNLLSRLGGGAKVLFRLAAMCPQRQPGTLYGENKTCKCHLLRRSRLYVKLSSQRCWSIALVVMAPEKSQFWLFDSIVFEQK